MIYFFKARFNPTDGSEIYYAVVLDEALTTKIQSKLEWLFDGRLLSENLGTQRIFIGPRAAMITPWSTNAKEITQNMGIEGIARIEQFIGYESLKTAFDPMVSQQYETLDQSIFEVAFAKEPIKAIDNIAAYNASEGLALSGDEVEYLEALATKLGRPLTDSEVFGFSQVNSEHCRHKIFNGTFIIDGIEKEMSLFQMIKATAKANPNKIVSAYKDNVAFVSGPEIIQFAPTNADKPSLYTKKKIVSVLSLKAETHNFPTTVEPFNGAATGSGGEIRDRMAGGQGSIPLAGTAVYMTASPRLTNDRPWEQATKPRPWLYRTPLDILIKASNGASDFGNKFGQPLIVGSLFTFEHEENGQFYGYDKVIMQAGGVGYGVASQAKKKTPEIGDQIVLLGGDNYRIGMGGAAVSSADTGAFESGIELNAVQRSNPEMQKRVANAIRALVESDNNPIHSIHDHGAGGHLNCFSELVEEKGGVLNIDALPLGDPSLSFKEIIGNESQERMGLIISKGDLPYLSDIAKRERAPFYVVGEVTGDHNFEFHSDKNHESPVKLALEDLFGNSPKIKMIDYTIATPYQSIEYDKKDLYKYLSQVLQLESVACKDWLTNKVDRCVGGRVAVQQCVGELQLPLNNCGVMALDYDGLDGVATSLGHSSLTAMIDPRKGSINAIAESLTNIVWAPIKDGLKGISLSANWMWPCKNPGEDARLYSAVEACSQFAIELGINIPTGKDSLSMKQKYKDIDVISPGTVIITAGGQCSNIKQVVTPVLRADQGELFYINMSFGNFELGGSAFGQILNRIGTNAPTVASAEKFKVAFDFIQSLVNQEFIVAGHDIGSGGLITSLLELCFPSVGVGADIDLTSLGDSDSIKVLFAENVGIIFQAKAGQKGTIEALALSSDVDIRYIGKPTSNPVLTIQNHTEAFSFDIYEYRKMWYTTSYHFDQLQSGERKAKERFDNFAKQPLTYIFPKEYIGDKPKLTDDRKKIVAAVIREKGSNSERELAHALYLAGFEVRDVHMTDLISGRETLEDVNFVGAVGGFSNSDVLGSAKGWAGSFKYNQKAKTALDQFFDRKDTLSIGICNGCQLFVELGLINPEDEQQPKMTFNDSHKHESAFTSVQIMDNQSIMMNALSGSKLGVWISHGEGKFVLPKGENNYNIVGKYGYENYPANPNGSDYNTAMMCSADGRHLVTMPHIERSIFEWNWADYPTDRADVVTPWMVAFTSAYEWLDQNTK